MKFSPSIQCAPQPDAWSNAIYAPQVRFMRNADLPEVVRMERECFPVPWTERDFLRVFRGREEGLVANLDGAIAAYMIFAPSREFQSVKILNLAVAPGDRRRGLGRLLLSQILDQLGYRRPIMAEVIETNVVAQCFFKAMGFRCTKILRRKFGERDEYRFVKRVNKEGSSIKVQGANFRP